MFDCHCDLLTYIYVNKNNIPKIKKVCESIYNKNNITGAIFNLFFMSKQEMKEELGIEENEINVIQMLKEVNEIIKKNNIIPPNIKYIYGVEGLDYLEKISDIDILYNLGMRSTNIVWNNKNQFGGGSKTEETQGLTSLGEELVEKLVKKEIAIDLSHTNKKTFFDIIDKCKELKKKGLTPKVFASHSNSRAICNLPRNLTDNQIISIKDMKGIIGVVEYKKFISENVDYEEKYIKHINHIKNILGDIKHIAVSTDDEIYYNKVLENSNLYKSNEVRSRIKQLLLINGYDDIEINDILYNNANRFILR